MNNKIRIPFEFLHDIMIESEMEDKKEWIFETKLGNIIKANSIINENGNKVIDFEYYPGID